MTIYELQARRTALLPQLRELRDKIADSSQTITEDDTQRYGELNKELDELDARIDAKRSSDGADTNNPGIGRHDFDNGHRIGRYTQHNAAPVMHRSCVPQVASMRTRETLRIVAPEESLSVLGHEKDFPKGMRNEPVPLGATLAGICLGDWRGAEEARALTSYEGSTGGFAIAHQTGRAVWDASRAKSRAIQGGVMTMPLEGGTTSIVLMDSDPAVYGKAENAVATESEPTFSQRTFNPVTRVIYVKFAREMLEDSVAPPGFFENAFASAMASDIDKMIFRGIGAAHEPTGIRHWSGINTTQLGSGTGAALSGFSDFLDAMQTVSENNGPEPSEMAAVMAPRTWYDLARKVDGQGVPLVAPKAFTDMRRLYTTQIQTDLTTDVAEAETYSNASEAYVGNFSQVILGIRQGITVKTTDQGAAMAANQIWLAVIVRYDVVIARANQLVLIEGVLADS